MRWVDTENYEGPDRRLKRLWRLIERRQKDQSTPLPSLSTKLRQLRVQVAGAHRPEGRTAFLRHAVATRALAELLHQQDAARTLQEVIALFETADQGQDPRSAADARLAKAAENLSLNR